MSETWITHTPKQRHLRIWFAVTSSICLTFTACVSWVDPQSSTVLCLAFVLLISMCGGLLLRARFRYNNDQIQCRYFRNIERKWEDVQAWSLLGGPRLNLYIRFADGVTIGSNQWISNTEEILELIPILTDKAGEPRIGKDSVLPWPYKTLLKFTSNASGSRFMDDEVKYAIPASSIGDTDLHAIAQTNRTAAKEIARLEALLGRGEETPEEFCTLCQLLHDVGEKANSEYLLRRNLDEDDPSCELYLQLFGNEKPDEFHAAIEVFKTQFNISLTFVEKNDFLNLTFKTDGGPPRSDVFSLLTRPCEIRFGFTRQDRIECDITLFDPARIEFHADECMLLNFANGVWKIANPLET